jgi:hypothetical protein
MSETVSETVSDTVSDTVSVLDLPVEIMLHIFSTLMAIDTQTLIVSVPMACRRWRAICCDYPLDVILDMAAVVEGSKYELSIESALEMVSSHFPPFAKIKMCEWARPLMQWLPTAHHLKHLDLSACYGITAVNMLTLIHPGLEHLNIANLNKNFFFESRGDVRYNISDAVVAALAGCNSLSYLDISCSDVSDAALDSALDANRRLKHLDLSCCAKITGKTLAGCTNLTHLSLSSCVEVTDDTVVALAAGCRKLEHLNLVSCNKITDAAVEALAVGCAGLENLNLIGCAKLTDAAFVALAAGCSGMRYLSIGECEITDESFAALAVGCSGLERMNVMRCDMITDMSALAICGCLKYLFIASCENLTADAVETFIADCKSLQTLHVIDCDYGENVLWYGSPE